MLLLIDPTGLMLGLKKIGFALFCFVSSIFFLSNKEYKISIKVIVIPLFFFLLVFLYGFIIAQSFSGNLSGSFVSKVFNTCLFSFFIVFTVINKVDIIFVVQHASWVLVLIVLYLAYLLYFNPTIFAETYRDFTQSYKVLGVGKRSYAGFQVSMIYWKTIFLMVFPLTYNLVKVFTTKIWISKIYYFTFSTCLIAILLLSGARTNIITCLLIVFLITILWGFRNKWFKLSILFTGITFVIIAVVFYIIVDSQESSIVTKSGHVNSYLHYFKNHPMKFFVGSGIGTPFFTEGRNVSLYYTELSYFDIIRFYGIIFGGVIIGMFVFPLIYSILNNKNLNQNRQFLISYTSYLLIAGTNPLLLSSSGLIGLTIGYYHITSNRITQLKNDKYCPPKLEWV